MLKSLRGDKRMLQNSSEGTIDRDEDKKQDKRSVSIFSNVLSISNIPIYIISLMISMVGITGDISPFSISLVGACIANMVPILGVVVFGAIGSAIKCGSSGVLEYILMTVMIIISMFIFKARINEEEKSEKVKLSKNIFISAMIIGLIKVKMNGFTIYDLLSTVSVAIIMTVFYKIFVNSVLVIRDYREQKAFSIEEVLGASLILAIAIAAFSRINIYGFSITNILSILIVLVLGWKNGILIGTTAGVTIGVTIGVITSSEPIMIAAYAISGMVAGILNRFGKLGVIFGFCIGNVILAYASNGYTVELIHFKEILIASIGLLAIPKRFKINIKDFMDKSNLLPIFPSRALNKSKETAERLNNVSNTIQEMAKVYKAQKDLEEEKPMQSNREVFAIELMNNLSGYEDNMLYDDIYNVEGPIVKKVFELLIEKQEIKQEDLLNIFAKCNSFIVSANDKDISSHLEENINQIIRILNMSYKISKSNFVWQKKLEENKKNIETQLEGVSKAISNIAENIEENITNEQQFINEKQQVINLLEEKDIEIQEVSIQKQERFLIEIYMKHSNNTDINEIERILTEVLKEDIVFNKEASIGTRLNFLSDDKFIMAVGNSKTTKDKSKLSGDNELTVRLKDGKYLIALSDGMGSGDEASASSNKALKMLENLLLSGFDKNTSIELINSALINQHEETFATLDIAIFDLYKGKIEFIKSGACPTYIKNRNKVQVVKTETLPVGIINSNNNLQVLDKEISNGDIVVMCTDGIIDSNVEYKNKELWVKYLLEDIETTNTKKISELILEEAIDNNYGVAKDDMSIVVCKLLEK